MKWEILREAAKASIMDVAVREFAEKGYNGATMRNIAARAGVSGGVIIKYFGSKENLLSEVIKDYRPEVIYEGVTETDPYRILCIYLDHIRKLQKEKPLQFKLHTSVINNVDFPESIHDTVREGFEGSILEDAIRRAQAAGELVQGDAYKIFRILGGAVYGLLYRYEAIGTAAPDNDALLNILGYNRKEKIYRAQAARVTELEEDLAVLIKALREAYPLSIRINLSKNTYRMIDYDNYSTRKADTKGNYDQLIAVGATTIPTAKDRKKFTALFDRNELIKGYRKGERERTLLHSQTGDDGINRCIETRCMMRENAQGEIIAVAVGGIVNKENMIS